MEGFTNRVTMVTDMDIDVYLQRLTIRPDVKSDVYLALTSLDSCSLTSGVTSLLLNSYGLGAYEDDDGDLGLYTIVLDTGSYHPYIPYQWESDTIRTFPECLIETMNEFLENKDLLDSVLDVIERLVYWVIGTHLSSLPTPRPRIVSFKLRELKNVFMLGNLTWEID